MRQRNRVLCTLLAGLGAASGLALASCNDHTTGQDPEPEGPLTITRVTLIDDHVSRDVAVFTDTSAPLDCKEPAFKDTERCTNDPFGDKFGLKKSPPTPDSGHDIRVVFNKLPLLLDGMDIETITKEPMKPPTKIELKAQNVLTLKCGDCTGVPPNTKATQLTGSELSPDPTVFPYGPALQIVLDTDDPLVALEPETEYSVEVNPGLSGRDGAKVNLSDPKLATLLKFRTEPFMALQAGIGDVDHDPYVYSQKTTAYEVEGLATNGVIAIKMNASVDPSEFKAGTATAKIGNVVVAVKIGVNQVTKNDAGKKVCDPGNQRTLYIYPAAQNRLWGAAPMKGDVVEITIKGADIRDVSQAANHPAKMGKHTLKSDMVIRATLSGKQGQEDEKYAGLYNDPTHVDMNNKPDPIQMVADEDDCSTLNTEIMDMARSGDM